MRRVDPDGNDNLDLDEPQPESASEDEDVDKNTESQASAAHNVDRTLVWEEFSEKDLVDQPRKEEGIQWWSAQASERGDGPDDQIQGD
jgi:hypothetical protein